MIVTDIKYKLKSGEIKKGYSMDGYLVENLSGIPAHLAKDWDVVGIVSGSGKVRISKSTISMQCAYYVAWMLAGGKMGIDRTDKSTWGKIIKYPDRPVKFNLYDNVVFSAQELMKKGQKAEKNTVFVLDEEEGLDAKSTMSNINRQMEDFFQKCGFKNHFIIVVLPDFFSLNKMIAASRSNFLINTYVGEKYQRGFFAFYNERKKELLYEFGRRKLGSHARYTATSPNFRGRFPNWLPFSKSLYEQAKKKALDIRTITKQDVRITKQRDVVIHMLKKELNMNSKEFSDNVSEEFGINISREIIRKADSHALLLKEKKAYLKQDKEEEEVD